MSRITKQHKMKKKYAIFLCFFPMQFIYARNSLTNFVNPQVAISNSGIIAIVYNTSPETGGNIFLSILDSISNFSCRSKIVNSGLSGYGQNADVGIDSRNNNVTVVWEQRDNSSSNLYKARFTENGMLIGHIQLVTDSIVSAATPRVAVHPGGKSIVVWIDYRCTPPAMFAQRYFENGEKKGNNFLVSKGKTLLQSPNVNIGLDLTLGFVWEDSEEGNFHIYFRSALWDSLLFTSIIKVDQSNGKAYASTPDVFVQKRGKYVVSWKDYREGESNIFFQALNDTIQTLKNIKVNDDTARLWQRLPSLAGDSVGNFLCVWEDYRNDATNQVGNIYAQIYSRSGKPIGKNIIVDEANASTAQQFPSVAMNASGDFVIVWNETFGKTSFICFKRFNNLGNSIHPLVRIFSH